MTSSEIATSAPREPRVSVALRSGRFMAIAQAAPAIVAPCCAPSSDSGAALEALMGGLEVATVHPVPGRVGLEEILDLLEPGRNAAVQPRGHLAAGYQFSAQTSLRLLDRGRLGRAP